MKKIKLKHSKGSLEYYKELRLRELLNESEEYQIEIEDEEKKKVKALLSREEMLNLKQAIEEALEKSMEYKRSKEITPPVKTVQARFNEDYIQQRNSDPIELDHDYSVKEKRK